MAKKRILSLLLAFTMMLSIIPMVTVQVAANTVNVALEIEFIDDSPPSYWTERTVRGTPVAVAGDGSVTLTIPAATAAQIGSFPITGVRIVQTDAGAAPAAFADTLVQLSSITIGTTNFTVRAAGTQQTLLATWAPHIGRVFVPLWDGFHADSRHLTGGTNAPIGGCNEWYQATGCCSASNTANCPARGSAITTSAAAGVTMTFTVGGAGAGPGPGPNPPPPPPPPPPPAGDGLNVQLRARLIGAEGNTSAEPWLWGNDSSPQVPAYPAAPDFALTVDYLISNTVTIPATGGTGLQATIQVPANYQASRVLTHLMIQTAGITTNNWAPPGTARAPAAFDGAMIEVTGFSVGGNSSIAVSAGASDYFIMNNVADPSFSQMEGHAYFGIWNAFDAPSQRLTGFSSFDNLAANPDVQGQGAGVFGSAPTTMTVTFNVTTQGDTNIDIVCRNAYPCPVDNCQNAACRVPQQPTGGVHDVVLMARSASTWTNYTSLPVSINSTGNYSVALAFPAADVPEWGGAAMPITNLVDLMIASRGMTFGQSGPITTGATRPPAAWGEFPYPQLTITSVRINEQNVPLNAAMATGDLQSLAAEAGQAPNPTAGYVSAQIWNGYHYPGFTTGNVNNQAAHSAGQALSTSNSVQLFEWDADLGMEGDPHGFAFPMPAASGPNHIIEVTFTTSAGGDAPPPPTCANAFPCSVPNCQNAACQPGSGNPGQGSGVVSTENNAPAVSIELAGRTTVWSYNVLRGTPVSVTGNGVYNAALTTLENLTFVGLALRSAGAGSDGDGNYEAVGTSVALPEAYLNAMVTINSVTLTGASGTVTLQNNTGIDFYSHQWPGGDNPLAGRSNMALWNAWDTPSQRLVLSGALSQVWAGGGTAPDWNHTQDPAAVFPAGTTAITVQFTVSGIGSGVTPPPPPPANSGGRWVQLVVRYPWSVVKGEPIQLPAEQDGQHTVSVNVPGGLATQFVQVAIMTVGGEFDSAYQCCPLGTGSSGGCGDCSGCRPFRHLEKPPAHWSEGEGAFMSIDSVTINGTINAKPNRVNPDSLVAQGFGPTEGYVFFPLWNSWHDEHRNLQGTRIPNPDGDDPAREDISWDTPITSMSVTFTIEGAAIVDTVDKSNLVTAITAMDAALAQTTESANGAGVTTAFWATADVMNTMRAAIAAAKAVNDNAAATQEQVDAARATALQATAVFNGARSTPGGNTNITDRTNPEFWRASALVTQASRTAWEANNATKANINDALQILRSIIGLDNEITSSDISKAASNIVTTGAPTMPNINDGLQILRSIIGLDNQIKAPGGGSTPPPSA
ncbi:MAG: hypothetical protein FWD35_01295 [Oscillospiraceae bacterium]|nr:hypothetical protein [Oscillospiraceae bacterium]